MGNGTLYWTVYEGLSQSSDAIGVYFTTPIAGAATPTPIPEPTPTPPPEPTPTFPPEPTPTPPPHPSRSPKPSRTPKPTNDDDDPWYKTTLGVGLLAGFGSAAGTAFVLLALFAIYVSHNRSRARRRLGYMPMQQTAIQHDN